MRAVLPTILERTLPPRYLPEDAKAYRNFSIDAVPQTVTHTPTITASQSCTALPDVARIRTYPAQVQEKSAGDIIEITPI